ncbi:MAG: hypothetical protein ACFFER_01810 [Candidatus Thorarchaeota archaeon]
MEPEEITEIIAKVLKIVEDVPEEYKLKTYEILLTNYLQPVRITREASPEERIEPDVTPDADEPFLVPIDVKAFMAQNGLSEELLKQLFLIEGNEIRPIFILKTTKKAAAQIQIACLLSLENALRGNRFEFSLEDARKRVQDFKAYDSKNFKPTFTRNKDLFGSLDDEEHISLSPAGKTELAEIIEEITK